MSRRNLRLLLVDDDHEDAFLFQRRCPERIALTHVTTAALGLTTLADGAFDACFVDYRLGTESGLDFVRAARARHAGLPLIVITGLQIEVLGENALLAGATDFIPKEHLDASTIERTVRWALIRRHVELQRDQEDHAAIVAKLMGRVPVDTLITRSPDLLRRVAYLSVARQPLSASDLLLMSSQFASANTRLGVGGVLAYAGERFVQVIEGPDAAVEVLLRRIQADPRHTRMHVILDESTGTRFFDGWRMAQIGSSIAVPKTAAAGAPADAGLRLQTLLGESTSRSGIERLLLALPELT